MFVGLKRYVRQFMTRNEIPVLNYHGVISEAFPFALPYHVSESRFREQIQYLSTHRRCVTADQLCAALESSDSSLTKAVAITFDDGFANNLYRALPILEEYAVPATIFVTTNYVGDGNLLWPERLAAALAASASDSVTIGQQQYPVETSVQKTSAYMAFTRYVKTREDRTADALLEAFMSSNGLQWSDKDAANYFEDLRMLDRDELRRLADHELITIGSHTCNHARLSQVEADQSSMEIVESGRWLGDEVQKVSYFAYPFGGYGEDFYDSHVEVVRKSGYRAAFAVGAGGASSRSNRYRIPRTNVTSDIDMPVYAYLAEGGSSQLHAGSIMSLAQGVISGSLAQADDQ